MIKVQAFHNIKRDEVGRPVGMLDGYQAGHPLVLVFVGEVRADRHPLTVAEEMYALLNVGHDPEFVVSPDERAIRYRYAGNRSLSVGDVVAVNGEYYSVESMGFTLLDHAPTIVDTGVEGSTPLRERDAS